MKFFAAIAAFCVSAALVSAKLTDEDKTAICADAALANICPKAGEVDPACKAIVEKVKGTNPQCQEVGSCSYQKEGTPDAPGGNGTTAAAGGAPAGNGTTPAAGGAAPAGNGTTPAAGGAAPAGNGTTAAAGGAAPAGNGTTAAGKAGAPSGTVLPNTIIISKKATIEGFEVGKKCDQSGVTIFTHIQGYTPAAGPVTNAGAPAGNATTLPPPGK